MDIEDFVGLGLHRSMWDMDFGRTVNGRSNQEIHKALQAPGDEQYRPCPEAQRQDGVAVGSLLTLAGWCESSVYAGTVRDVWIQAPAELAAGAPPPGVIVFQDGGAYLDPQGPVRAATVLDNLNAASAAAPLVGVFVNPGRPAAADDGPRDELAAMRQRSIEYDTCNDRYEQFLTTEILPLVEARIGCRLTDDPRRRLLCGISSGGIAAFNGAWHAPERFGGVLSHCGSFTNIRGGHNYPYLVRMTPRKPIRVVLQSGIHDADILCGSWPLANQAMAAALAFAGYDHRFLFGQGGHSLRHGGQEFAHSLRWLLAPGVPQDDSEGAA